MAGARIAIRQHGSIDSLQCLMLTLQVIASPNFLRFFNTTQTSAIIGAINSTFSGGGRSCRAPLRYAKRPRRSSVLVINSCDRFPTRRFDHGPLRPQVHHSDGGLDLSDRCNTAGGRTEPSHDLGRPHPGGLGRGTPVHVGAGLPGRVCPPTISRVDCRNGAADDWRWVYREHVC